jgi:PAS domain S-box-containing protein
MHDSEAHFRTLLDSSPDAIVIADPEEAISIVNSQTSSS